MAGKKAETKLRTTSDEPAEAKESTASDEPAEPMDEDEEEEDEVKEEKEEEDPVVIQVDGIKLRASDLMKDRRKDGVLPPTHVALWLDRDNYPIPKPPTAYICFCGSVAPRLVSPGRAAKCMDMWNKLSHEARRPFDEQSKALKKTAAERKSTGRQIHVTRKTADSMLKEEYKRMRAARTSESPAATLVSSSSSSVSSS